LYAVWGTPDLYGDIKISDESIVANQAFSFTVTIGNRDTDKSLPWYNTNVLVTLPTGANYIAVPEITLNGVATSIPYTYNAVDHTISFPLGTLEPGQEYKLVYILQAKSDVIAGDRLESSFLADGEVSLNGLARAATNMKSISGSAYTTIRAVNNSFAPDTSEDTSSDTGGRFGGTGSGTINK
jgi:hypothetical protein